MAVHNPAAGTTRGIQRCNLGKFANRFKGTIGAVSGGEIDAWLRSSRGL